MHLLRTANLATDVLSFGHAKARLCGSVCVHLLIFMLSDSCLTGTFRGTSGSGGQDEDKILGILTLWLVEVSYMSSSVIWLALYMPFWLIIVEYIPFRVVLLNVFKCISYVSPIKDTLEDTLEDTQTPRLPDTAPPLTADRARR